MGIEPVAPLACLPASARGYLAIRRGNARLLNTGGWISFTEWRPAGSFNIRHTSFPKNNLQVHLGSHQSRLGLEQQEPGRGGPIVKLENLTSSVQKAARFPFKDQ